MDGQPEYLNKFRIHGGRKKFSDQLFYGRPSDLTKPVVKFLTSGIFEDLRPPLVPYDSVETNFEMLEALTETLKWKVLQHSLQFEAIVDELADLHEPIVVCWCYAIARATVFVCQLKRIRVGVIRQSTEGLRAVVQLKSFDDSRYSH